MESRFKNNGEAKVLQRRNTYEGFKSVAAQSLNLDPNSAGITNQQRKGGALSSVRTPFEYDEAELQKKSPEELDAILNQMDRY